MKFKGITALLLLLVLVNLGLVHNARSQGDLAQFQSLGQLFLEASLPVNNNETALVYQGGGESLLTPLQNGQLASYDADWDNQHAVKPAAARLQIRGNSLEPDSRDAAARLTIHGANGLLLSGQAVSQIVVSDSSLSEPTSADQPGRVAGPVLVYTRYQEFLAALSAAQARDESITHLSVMGQYNAVSRSLNADTIVVRLAAASAVMVADASPEGADGLLDKLPGWSANRQIEPANTKVERTRCQNPPGTSVDERVSQICRATGVFDGADGNQQ
ncbi:hypothetical protein [Oceanobacter mangrovi]|uniref:hypothetical protein n=1 Tax=Oceanobacter mangrovi TaxID=2862510 RepID=UPI001C8DC5D6|nr:hypothetical protein [Oceanobacter mangrovi]